MKMGQTGQVSHQAKVTNVRAVRSQSKARRTNQTSDAADDGPDLTSTFESSGKVAPVYKDGVKSQDLGEGRHKYATDSGMQLKHDEKDQSFELKMPNGYTVSRGEEGLKATGPDGKSVGNPTMSEEKGQPFVSFKDKEGSQFKVNMETLGVEATDKTGTVRQTVSTQGDHMVAIAPDGKKGDPEMFAFFEKGKKPDIDPEMKFSADGKKVTYETMDGATHTKKLPLQMESGEAKAKPEAGAKPDAGAKQGGDGKVEAAAGVGGAAAGAVGDDYATRKTGKAEAAGETGETQPGYMSKSGVSKTELEDGSVKTSMGNGAYVLEKPDGTVKAFDSKGKETEVHSREFMNESGQRDVQFTFQEGDNRHSLFKYSMDSVAENKDGSRAQIAHSDGRIFSVVREPGGKVHTSTLYPDGHPTRGSQGVTQENPGVMKIDGKEVEMPFGKDWKTPAEGKATQQYMPSSGVVPNAFPTLEEAQRGGHMHAAAKPMPGMFAHPGANMGYDNGMGMDYGMGMPGMPGMYHNSGMSKAMTFMMIASTLSSALMPLMMMGSFSPMMMMF